MLHGIDCEVGADAVQRESLPVARTRRACKAQKIGVHAAVLQSSDLTSMRTTSPNGRFSDPRRVESGPVAAKVGARLFTSLRTSMQ